MRKVKVSEIEYGMALLDMHYGLYKDERLRETPIEGNCTVLSHIETHAIRGSQFIETNVTDKTGECYLYLNKMLVVVDVAHEYQDGTYVPIITAAYSYDDMRFGMVKIEAKEP